MPRFQKYLVERGEEGVPRGTSGYCYQKKGEWMFPVMYQYMCMYI